MPIGAGLIGAECDRFVTSMNLRGVFLRIDLKRQSRVRLHSKADSKPASGSRIPQFKKGDTPMNPRRSKAATKSTPESSGAAVKRTLNLWNGILVAKRPPTLAQLTELQTVGAKVGLLSSFIFGIIEWDKT
ncbi:MAG TPA: hypothetical protein VFJ90_15085, partial [Candidatus Didemnitutus sp.]|nr:hypothetical protein [Candidatus Didemnitutus sp.]